MTRGRFYYAFTRETPLVPDIPFRACVVRPHRFYGPIDFRGPFRINSTKDPRVIKLSMCSISYTRRCMCVLYVLWLFLWLNVKPDDFAPHPSKHFHLTSELDFFVRTCTCMCVYKTENFLLGKQQSHFGWEHFLADPYKLPARSIYNVWNSSRCLFTDRPIKVGPKI